MKKVDIYTDGACSGNPGDGGWGAVLIYGEHEKEISGFEKDTTNNRMELTAAIRALEALKVPCRINLYSDSAYLVNAFNKGWLERWKLNGWINKKKEDVKNAQLWKRLDELNNVHDITWLKVKGHSDNIYNNICDTLATGEIKNNISTDK